MERKWRLAPEFWSKLNELIDTIKLSIFFTLSWLKKSSFYSKSKIVFDNRPQEVPCSFMCCMEWHLLGWFILGVWNASLQAKSDLLLISGHKVVLRYSHIHVFILSLANVLRWVVVWEIITSQNSKYLLSGPCRQVFSISALYKEALRVTKVS